MRDYYIEEEKWGTFAKNGLGGNPFLGLRSFSLDESHLFFGREAQVDEILLKLSSNKLISILGYSGSGKSSLLVCGLIPKLLGGELITKYGSNWRILNASVGNSPVANLAKALVGSLVQSNTIDAGDKKNYESFLCSVLNRSKTGLIDAVKLIQKENENIFLSIDQFEEIFQSLDTMDADARREAAHYVNLIQEVSVARDLNLYMALSMRSDYVGQCALFPGLTGVINGSNFLLPEMTREQKRLAIESPIKVGGGTISPRLVQRFLHDLGENEDQLIVMQHTLMRLWDHWASNRNGDEPIDISHYIAIGGVSNALSKHANDVYSELSSRQKEIARTLLKSLAERTQEGIEAKRRVKIDDISALLDVNQADVIQVVDVFRRPGRSFILPSSSEPLTEASIIELSHESIIRLWNRLTNWVNEEYASSLMYKRISEAAAMQQQGKGSLWRPPDLQDALDWKKRQNPTPLWARRYDNFFERSIVFLEASRIAYKQEQEGLKMLQLRSLRRSRILNSVLLTLLFVSIGLFVFGYIQQIKAEQKAKEALIQAQLAKDKKKEAEEKTEEANQQKKLVEEALLERNKTNEELKKQRNELNQKQRQLERALRSAEEKERQAKASFEEAQKQKNIAVEAREEALFNYQRAEDAANRIDTLLHLIVAQSVEAKSLSIDDPELSGLTAMQGYNFHAEFKGKRYDPYVFSGLYNALLKLKDVNYTSTKQIGDFKNKIYGLAVSKKNSVYYTAGTDGRIIVSNHEVEGNRGAVIYANSGYIYRTLALSKDEKYLVCSGDSLGADVFDFRQLNAKPVRLMLHTKKIADIKFMPDNQTIISASVDGELAMTQLSSGRKTLLTTLPYPIQCIDVQKDGKKILIGSIQGHVALYDINANTVLELHNEAPHHVLSVAFHPTKPIVAYGIEEMNLHSNLPDKGTVRLMELISGRVVTLTGHTSGVAKLDFDNSGELLASAGLDGKVQMWVVDHSDDLPIVINNPQGNMVWNVGFTYNSQYLIATSNNGEIRIWPTDPKLLADMMCANLSRGRMTIEEWETYVSKEIDYEETCQREKEDAAKSSRP